MKLFLELCSVLGLLYLILGFCWFINLMGIQLVSQVYLGERLNTESHMLMAGGVSLVLSIVELSIMTVFSIELGPPTGPIDEIFARLPKPREK